MVGIVPNLGEVATAESRQKAAASSPYASTSRSAEFVAAVGEAAQFELINGMRTAGVTLSEAAAGTLAQQLRAANGNAAAIDAALVGAGVTTVTAEMRAAAGAWSLRFCAPRPRINMGRQGKHIVGHNNYDPLAGRSELTYTNPQALLDQFSGSGTLLAGPPLGVNGAREIVEFGEVIGVYFSNGLRVGNTTRGTIHYAANGEAHIVPAPPIAPIP